LRRLLRPQIAADNPKDVVEIMRTTAGEHADRRHFRDWRSCDSASARSARAAARRRESLPRMGPVRG
jgi:hypothetical protein